MNSEKILKLKVAIQIGKDETEIISQLEQYDTDVDLLGGTPLNHAVNYERMEITKYLLKRGANVNHKQDGTYTPLMSACEGDNVKLVKLLLDAGADINIKDEHGNNALWKATFNENEAIVRMLLENGADPYEKLNDGETIYESSKRMELDKMLELFDNYKN